MNSLLKRSGFTLIELIVVVAIMGILTSIAVPKFIGTLSNARTVADNSTERIVVTAVQHFYAKYGTYPTGATATERLNALKSEFIGTSELKWSNNDAISGITVDSTTGDVIFTPARPTP